MSSGFCQDNKCIGDLAHREKGESCTYSEECNPQGVFCSPGGICGGAGAWCFGLSGNAHEECYSGKTQSIGSGDLRTDPSQNSAMMTKHVLREGQNASKGNTVSLMRNALKKASSVVLTASAAVKEPIVSPEMIQENRGTAFQVSRRSNHSLVGAALT